MQIGNVEIKGRAALAPMAGVGDRAYRKLNKEFGACYVVSEMVSAKGICYNDAKTAELCGILPEERPMGIQLFGAEPEFMAKAVKRVLEFKPDIIDINMGCPVAKVIKQGAGCALMRTPSLASDLVKAAKSATDLPVTVKIRAGWDSDNVNAADFAQKLALAGAAAVAIHGRTKTQLYGGKSALDIIRKVKYNIDIPVIGNGDVFSAADCERMYKETGCDLVMVGRGSYGNPWVFKSIVENREIKPSLEEKLDVMIYHVKLIMENYPEFLAMREARKYVMWYIKGVKNAAFYRNRCRELTVFGDVEELANEIREVEFF